MRLWLPSFALVLAYAVLAKLFGALKEVAMAQRLGTSALVDQYVLAFSVATWPAAVVTSIFTVALVPLVATQRLDEPEALRPFLEQLNGLMWSLGIVIFAVLAVFLVFWLGQPDASVGAASGGSRSLLVALAVAGGLGLPLALSSSLLVANSRYAVSLIEGIPSLVLALALLLWVGEDAAVIAGATVVGFLALLGLSWRMQTGFGGRGVAWPSAHPCWSSIRHRFGYSAMGFALLALAPIAEQTFASLLGSGQVATLSYANRLGALASGLIVTCINRVTLPAFSRESSTDLRAIRLAMAASLALGSLIAIVMAALGHSLVEMLFQRGNFTAADTARVAQVLSWQVSHLGPYFLTVVACAWLAAKGAYLEVFVACIVCLLTRLLASAVAGMWAQDLLWLSVAPTVGYVAMGAYLFFAITRWVRRQQPNPNSVNR